MKNIPNIFIKNNSFDTPTVQDSYLHLTHKQYRQGNRKNVKDYLMSRI